MCASVTVLRSYPDQQKLRWAVAAIHPTTAIIGLDESENGLAILRELRGSFPEVVRIAAHTHDIPELILEALRAGACEFLGPPFPAGYLERGLERRWPLRRLGAPKRGN